ncbi:hypothetical protein [Arcticibacter eurypsychrophilus]|uniref:hypothetical protein n=1 Tax=Arcticibacter eurypsychrophilus TaxID=1434752 RepID=UPI001112F07A|nr:hypothetical protein [Arcticibacter eurypsychrophilus]
MNRSSQKSINDQKAVYEIAKAGFTPDAKVRIVRSANSSHFTGMSLSIERVSALIIPGYKIRG